MPKHTVHWVNDHTEICDRLDERVQLMIRDQGLWLYSSLKACGSLLPRYRCMHTWDSHLQNAIIFQ